jgi:hypothetical protein
MESLFEGLHPQVSDEVLTLLEGHLSVLRDGRLHKSFKISTLLNRCDLVKTLLKFLNTSCDAIRPLATCKMSIEDIAEAKRLKVAKCVPRAQH